MRGKSGTYSVWCRTRVIPMKFLIIIACNLIWFGFLFWLITS